ncbi:hypothetical protein AAC387_Pa05g1000 [Persea americana]
MFPTVAATTPSHLLQQQPLFLCKNYRPLPTQNYGPSPAACNGQSDVHSQRPNAALPAATLHSSSLFSNLPRSQPPELGPAALLPFSSLKPALLSRPPK